MINSARPHIVVIGGGFGGLAAVDALRDVAARVTLIDANNFHTFQPLLYQVATAGLEPGDVGHPLRAALRPRRKRSSRADIDFVLGRVIDIATDTRVVTLADDRTITYDYLIVAAGAVSTDFGVPGVAEHGLGLKSIDDAVAIRDQVLTNVEQAAQHAATGANHDVSLNVVVVGGGPTGVEMAGGLAELYRHVLDRDFPRIDFTTASITLVELGERVLSPFHPSLSASAEKRLQNMGVDVLTGVGVDAVTADSVTLSDGRVLDAGVCVWAAGVRAHPLAASLGVELGRGGRLPVEADLQVTGLEQVYAIGDIAGAVDAEGKFLPQVAQPAIQGGKHVAKQIQRHMSGASTRPFVYRDRGSMATIGRNAAVAELANGWRFKGFVGWAAWLGLHLLYLVGFRNRVSVFVNWAWNWLTFDRAARLLDIDRAAELRRPDLV